MRKREWNTVNIRDAVRVCVCVCVCRFTGFGRGQHNRLLCFNSEQQMAGSFLLLSETYSGKIQWHMQPSQPSGSVCVCVWVRVCVCVFSTGLCVAQGTDR